MFEQSGIFRDEFRKLGYDAECYDIQNQYNQTDHVIDLFSEIDRAYGDEKSCTIFDSMSRDDLIIAFYPCTYFCAMSQVAFNLGYRNYQKLNFSEKIEKILQRSNNRKEYYDRLIRFVAVCVERNLRMVFENPWSEQTYLKANFLKKPDIVDTNRMERGDYFVKPTAYWFWNCQPTHGFTYQNDKEKKKIMDTKKSDKVGMCSKERSLISSDYARNWIYDFILGIEQKNISQLTLFD